MYTLEEKKILMELAKQYRALAQLPKNDERKNRLQAVNDLTTGLRPAVWIHEIPWHEMNIDGALDISCTDTFAREMEWYFKTALYREKYLDADTIFPFYYPIHKAYSSTGDGVEHDEQILKTDVKNNIVSHAYHDKLSTDEDVAKLQEPVLTAHRDVDAEKVKLAQDILGDILPVKLLGHQIYYAPWDVIPRLRGVEPILMDMIDRPEFLHKIISKFTSNQMSVMTQMETLDLLEDDLLDLHCTPPFTSTLKKSPSDQFPKLKNVWMRSMAQMFGSVSPAMHEEFELAYMRPLMERCGLVYYGCCEPLDNKISLLKSIPNLRKIGVSPWANVESSAEQIGNKYVFARKPNPAYVATTLDESVVRLEIIKTVEACQKFNCPFEFVLKDISTISYSPQNLIRWYSLVKSTLDSYYA